MIHRGEKSLLVEGKQHSCTADDSRLARLRQSPRVDRRMPRLACLPSKRAVRQSLARQIDRISTTHLLTRWREQGTVIQLDAISLLVVSAISVVESGSVFLLPSSSPVPRSPCP